MMERRGAARHRVFKRGTIAFSGAGFDCTVRNLSATGARIDVDGPVALPDRFVLAIETDKVILHCRAVWKAAQRIGVVFN